MKKLLIAMLIVAGLTSCNNYYKAITASEPKNAAGYSDFQDSKKYYILRNGSDAFSMKNISVSSNRKTVQCTLEELPLDHRLYVKKGIGGKYKTKNYTDEDESGVLNEVHIYIAPGIKTATGEYSLAMEDIQKAEIIEKDKIKTRKSHVAGTAVAIGGTAVAAGLIIGLIVASGSIFY